MMVFLKCISDHVIWLKRILSWFLAALIIEEKLLNVIRLLGLSLLNCLWLLNFPYVYILLDFCISVLLP